MSEDIRWKQRFENFGKARQKFHQALNAYLAEKDNELYQMALIQTFEFTYESGWKTIKDYLLFQGVKRVTLPREVIKQGFHHQIIDDGQAWIDMLEDRNLMAHTYDEKKAEKAVSNIANRYAAAVDQVFIYFKEKYETNSCHLA